MEESEYFHSINVLNLRDVQRGGGRAEDRREVRVVLEEVAVVVDWLVGDGRRRTPAVRVSELGFRAAQVRILSQSPTDATRFWWHLYGS